MLLGVASIGGGVDAARCGGQPDKIVTEDVATWDSPGEVISFFNKMGFHYDPEGGGVPHGQVVKEFCAGPNP